MTKICGKWLKYVLKWLKYWKNGSKMLKMTWRFGKWSKYLGNGLDAWDRALEFEKRLNCVENGLRI